jgi:hypothetical protein
MEKINIFFFFVEYFLHLQDETIYIIPRQGFELGSLS